MAAALLGDAHAAEGAGASTRAAARCSGTARAPYLVEGRRAAVVLCGGNVDADVFATVAAARRRLGAG
jgi:threonine dehydratase